METQYVLHRETGEIMEAVDGVLVKQWDQEFGLQTYGRLPICLVRGKGVRVWDDTGKEYLDLLAGIAVNSVGHCHPNIVAAIHKQAQTLMHTSNFFYNAPAAALARRLVQLSAFERAFFCNSGAEANEAAIKIARKFGKASGSADKYHIVAAQASFHGRTMATVTATGQPKYQAPFAPMLPGVSHVPYNDVDALAEAVTDDTCAVLLEPILGESGVFPASPAFLDAARALCDEHGALLIFDEIQTGVGRTGKWWAYERYGVVPDIMTLAKGLGGGFPIGAVLARGAAASTLTPGDHGTTFGGNPLATCTALAVLETIEEEHLVANSAAMGSYFAHLLRDSDLARFIEEVRAVGLMIGVTLSGPYAKQVQSKALERGVIVNAVGDSILRIVPPLTIRQSDIDQAVRILTQACELSA